MGASGKRARLARRVWRPAKHILVRCSVAPGDTPGIHKSKTHGKEKRGEVRRETLALQNYFSGFRGADENAGEPAGGGADWDTRGRVCSTECFGRGFGSLLIGSTGGRLSEMLGA